MGWSRSTPSFGSSLVTSVRSGGHAVELFALYAEYAEKTDREIPVFIASPA